MERLKIPTTFFVITGPITGSQYQGKFVGRPVEVIIQFYAVAERKKQLQDGYEPSVWVCTKKKGNNIVMVIKDNGNGIPPKVVDKIFQPFFTTKPTGQGTGLGLSLSYDIIKAHGGTIEVKTREKEFTEFIFILPV